LLRGDFAGGLACHGYTIADRVIFKVIGVGAREQFRHVVKSVPIRVGRIGIGPQLSLELVVQSVCIRINKRRLPGRKPRLRGSYAWLRGE